MADTIVSNDFFAEAFHGVYSLPLSGFALVGGVGVSNVVDGLLLQRFGHAISAPGYIAAGLLAAVWLASVYVIAMMIAKCPISWSGGLKFSAIMILYIGFPISAVFGGLFLMRTNGGVAAVVLVLTLLLSLVAFPMLAAWPVAQALSGRFVSPIRILKSTKGYRWGMFAASYASTAINKILPATDTAKGHGQAVILAIGNGAISCASLILFASVAATAWKFAVRQDPTLANL